MCRRDLTRWEGPESPLPTPPCASQTASRAKKGSERPGGRMLGPMASERGPLGSSVGFTLGFCEREFPPLNKRCLGAGGLSQSVKVTPLAQVMIQRPGMELRMGSLLGGRPASPTPTPLLVLALSLWLSLSDQYIKSLQRIKDQKEMPYNWFSVGSQASRSFHTTCALVKNIVFGLQPPSWGGTGRSQHGV